ncbi:MAG: NADH-quinone oxidoreductase subunit N [Bacteroidetes bacterium]|nr:NADH-quinone oxidoreductase subunit N [Bacteroidota bacterium]
MKILYILSGLGVIAMLAEMFRFKKFLLPIVLVGLLGAIACVVKDWNTDIHYYSDMLTFNNYALLFSCVIIGTAFLWFMMSGNFFREETSRTDHFALVLFALCGAVILVSYSNMVMLFLGIEILSIPLYVLAGSRKDDLASNESALKYFLMGAFATGFLLFGIALLYGCFGTFNIHTIQTYLNPPMPSQARPSDAQWVLLSGGILFMLIGMSFKISAVPFHFWAPDVYTGAPTQVTAFMSSIVKTAAFAAFLRLFICFAGVGQTWTNIIWIMSAATILLGNITAVYQSNVKRMLAYSSISHAGYMLLAIIAMNTNSAGSILFYAAAYSVSTIGAFAVLTILENTSTINHQPSTIAFDSLSGLAKRNPLAALAMCIAMLSLSGIPPLAGFFGKYYIFTSALTSGYVWLVLIAVLGSLIGVYYYFRVIISMYLKESSDTSSIEVSLLPKILLVITIVLALALGIFPDLVIRLI